MKPLNLGVSPSRTYSGVGLTFRTEVEVREMSKNAPDNGVYELDGVRYVAQKDQPMPDGAVFETVVEEDPEEKSVKAAPSNKAQAGAPSNKSA